MCFRFRQESGNAAEGAKPFFAADVKRQAVSGGQVADAAIKRVGRGDVAPEEIADVAGRFGRGVNAAAGQQRFDLRRHAEGLAIVRVIERLDAKRVAREKEGFLPVPDGKREHAAQFFQHGLAVLRIKVEQNFGVAGGTEPMCLSVRVRRAARGSCRSRR